jgi:hypothetical protein
VQAQDFILHSYLILSYLISSSLISSSLLSPVTGVAMLVPLIWCTAQDGPPSLAQTSPPKRACSVTEGSPDQADCTKSPGATTSGLMRPSLVGPMELKHARRLD